MYVSHIRIWLCNTGRTTISTERKYCVTHFDMNIPPSTNMIKSLVYRFKTRYTEASNPQSSV